MVNSSVSTVLCALLRLNCLFSFQTHQVSSDFLESTLQQVVKKEFQTRFEE